MAEREFNLKPFRKMYPAIVISLMALSLVKLALAVCLSLFADTTLLIQTADGVIV